VVCEVVREVPSVGVVRADPAQELLDANAEFVDPKVMKVPTNPKIATRGRWGDYKPARGFGKFNNGVQLAAQARLDRARGRVAYNLAALSRAGHLAAHLPHDYRERYEPEYRLWHEEQFGFGIRIACLPCGQLTDAVSKDAAFKKQNCPLGGTLQSVRGLEKQLVLDKELIAKLRNEVTDVFELVPLSLQSPLS
jgi:hypothetical protein